MTKKKKQHYVPQCYLAEWCMPNTNQINVFDKKQEVQRVNNIEDVASENYFYDINLEAILSQKEIEYFGLENEDLSQIDDGQYLENLFSNTIEQAFKFDLNRIIQRVRKMNTWEIQNCLFVNSQEKKKFSLLMAVQYVRVKNVRDTIAESANLLQQVLVDMGVSKRTIDQYCNISKNQLKYIHGKIVVNYEEIGNIAQILNNHIWILLKNNTKEVFFTSDNPIGTIAHIRDPIVSMSGVNSRGVEIYFPLSPDLLLVAFEKTYHKDIECYSNRVVETDNVEIVKYYNSVGVINSSRCVYSSNDDFSLVYEMRDKKENVLKTPKSIVHWDGKTYHPNR